MSFEWKKLIGSVAPALATALGSPLAGAAVSALSRAVLNKADGTEKELSAALANVSPETLAQIKKADQDFATKMAELGVDLEKIAAADRDSARQREVKTGDSWTPRLLAGIVVCGWMLVQWFLLNHIVPQEMRDIVMRSLGTIDMALGLVLGYYFGSSAGSDKKNELIRKLTTQ